MSSYRWWLYERIDRLDTYCLTHVWVPSWFRIAVGRVWEQTFRDITLTAVDNPFESPKESADD